MLICRFGGPKSAMTGPCAALAITSHPQLQLQKSEPRGSRRWPLPCSRQRVFQRSETVAIRTSLASIFSDLLFRILHEKGTHLA